MQQLYSFFKGDCNNTKSFSVTLFWYQYCWIWTNSVLAVYMLSYNLLKFFSEWIVEEKYKMLVASANWFFFLKFSKQPRNRRKTWCEGRHLVLLVYRLYVHQYCFFLNMWRYLCVKETTEYLILVATTLGTFGSKFNINISNEFIKSAYNVLVKIRNKYWRVI